jgi:hypothetical protein
MNDDQLRRLLSDAVSDVEPHERLDQIRSSVRPDSKVVPMSRNRSWIAVVGVAAAVAVIGGVAFAAGALQGNNADDNTPLGPSPTHHSTPPVTPPTSTATDPTSSGTTGSQGVKAYAVYYVGDSPAGKPVLFREFHSGPAATDPAALAVADLGSLPLDPDYTTPWQAGDLTGATANAGVIDVTLGSASVHDRPAGMSAAYANAAIEQVIYTVQAAFQSRMPVQFMLGGNPVDQVLGVPTSEPLSHGKVITTLSLMNISNPYYGYHAKRGKLVVDGVNNGFEGTVVLRLMQGTTVVLQKAGIGGFGLTNLYPWKLTLDTSKVPAGKYTLVATNDDPSGQGNPATDTKTIYLK